MTVEEIKKFRELLVNCDTHFEVDQVEAAVEVFSQIRDQLIPQGRPDREKIDEEWLKRKLIELGKLMVRYPSFPNYVIEREVKELIDQIRALYPAVPQGDDKGLLTDKGINKALGIDPPQVLKTSMLKDNYYKIAEAQRDLTRQEILEAVKAGEIIGLNKAIENLETPLRIYYNPMHQRHIVREVKTFVAWAKKRVEALKGKP